MQTKIALLAPLVVVPLITLLAWTMGVGKETPPAHARGGLTAKVPAPLPEKPRKETKLDLYDQMKQDSERAAPEPVATIHSADSGAAHVKRSLERLQAALSQRAPEVAPRPERVVPPLFEERHIRPPVDRDTEMDRLDAMLDKIIRIQHPTSARAPDTALAATSSLADTAAVPEAITETEGTLVSGETIALRLEDDLFLKSGRVPSGTRLYGTVSLDNERLHIRIRSILCGRSILRVSLEAYDLDGQPGIYVPGSLNRDVASASADETLGELNLGSFDPSVGAQATSAGIQAVKSLLSHKIRQVRVTLRPGYRVLIK